MIKDKKIDFKLVNIAILCLIVYLMYHTGHLWIGIFSKIFSILVPFLVGFAVAYSLHPIVVKLQDKRIPKSLAIFMVIALLLFLVIFMGYIISTTCVSQISTLFDNLNSFINKLSTYDLKINISGLQETINNNFQNILTNVTKYVSNGAVNLVSSSIDFIGDLFIGTAAFIYFLIDMDKIRINVKSYFFKKNKRTYRFVKLLDDEMKDYLGGLVQVMVISIFEYGIAYLIIGHPNAIALAIMAGLANFIPYFGGIINNVVAAFTAFIISPALFIRTLIVFFVLSLLDSYVINPHVYGKTNQMHPLVTIFALFAGGALFGIVGVFISFPLAIFIVSLFKFYKDDISDGIEKIKENNRQETTS